jgi:8-oxo-dGTP pyrophosphatase MutT (NUDIX family)
MSPYYRQLRAKIGTQMLLVPCVAGLVHDAEGRLLLQEKDDGSWSLPAGAIEPGEDAESAMRRELYEETGLVATKLTLLGCFSGERFRFTYPDQNQVEYIVLMYRCNTSNLELAPIDPETVSLGFFAKRDFPGLALPYPLETLYSIG